MKRNDYVNAVDHLHFSDHLAHRVRAAAPVKQRFRLPRAALLAAVLCLALATSVAAASGWLSREIGTETLGTVTQEEFESRYMEFSKNVDLSGVMVHTMELNEDDYFLFGHGLLYSHDSGFLRVGEDFALEQLEQKLIRASLFKDGHGYRYNLCYVEQNGGIVDNRLFFYDIVEGKVLVNLWSGVQRCWPVWIDLETGTCEDALPELSTGALNGQVRYAESFRGGILLSCVSDDGYSVYWVNPDSTEVELMNIPARDVWDYVFGDEYFYRNADGSYFRMESWNDFSRLEEMPRTPDDMWCGLVSCMSGEENLQVYDFSANLCYEFPGVDAVEKHGALDYNVTRYSQSGTIAVVRSYYDVVNSIWMVDRIGYLDMDTGECRLVYIQSEQNVWTHGWLDDHRYAVITEDGNTRYLTVYEFDA